MNYYEIITQSYKLSCFLQKIFSNNTIPPLNFLLFPILTRKYVIYFYISSLPDCSRNFWRPSESNRGAWIILFSRSEIELEFTYLRLMFQTRRSPTGTSFSSTERGAVCVLFMFSLITNTAKAQLPIVRHSSSNQRSFVKFFLLSVSSNYFLPALYTHNTIYLSYDSHFFLPQLFVNIYVHVLDPF